MDDTCIRYGICQKVCPNQNIVLENDSLSFRHRCDHCVACINNCPQSAIQWKRSTKKRARYKKPGISVKEIVAEMQK
ncbi:MAG: EFR1 family ferrodoxin [Clostridiaceae bacterium]|nr:EFR1 family ferrodoxin [Clostridiaceae bacterium]